MVALVVAPAVASSVEEEVQYVPNEVVAAVSSQAEAEAVASYYGITLESYAYGVAVYNTSTSNVTTESVVSQSQIQTFSVMPTLYENRVYNLFETEIVEVENSDLENLEIEELAYSQNSSLNSAYYQYHLDDISAYSAWSEDATGKGVVVAIIDTGVDTDHASLTAALSDKMYYNSETQKDGADAVEDIHGHGTHVAGIVAANKTVYGVAPDVDLMIIKAYDDEAGNFSMDSLIRGINYAVANGADIINLSLGSSYYGGSYQLEEGAIDAAVAAGVVVVCAAGNANEDHAAYPAAYDSTIAVSATSSGFAFDSSYSNFGSEIDVAAPGTSILSTYNTGGYAYITGTSMACPVVTGIVALIMSANSGDDYTPAEIRTILTETAMEAGDLGFDYYYGYGAVNAYSAVLGTDKLYEVSYYEESQLLASTYVAPGGNLIEPNYSTGSSDFLGWTSAYYGSETWDFDDPVTEALDLYAKWEIANEIVYTYENNISTVNITFCPDATIAASGQVMLALYENGQMKAVSMETYENIIEIEASYNGSVDEAKIFMLDGTGNYIPLAETTIYDLEQ